ncbi:MAG: lactonase family protein [Burkholderiaceae bacterium]|nr:lactonase family protein [Burkholderiaceae bacterium]
MNTFSRRNFVSNVVVLTAALAAAVPALAHRDHESDRDYHERHSYREGKVFISTNAPGNNELLVLAPDDTGSLSLVKRVATNGQGTGAGLGSQGAVTLSTNGRYAFVVNAASNTVSTFALGRNSVELTSAVDSGGLQPISVTEYEGIVYVLNAGGSGNVAGFRNTHGQLRPLHDGVRALSAAGGTNAAQVGFGADGEVLVVTEKATNSITSYNVRRNGTLSQPIVTPSSGQTPFGFAFDKRDYLIVSEATASGASSYRFPETGPAMAQLISASVPNTQGAACWVVTTPNGRYAYTTNAATSTLSSYRIARSGSIELANAVAGTTGVNAGALDMAVTPDGEQLYAFAHRSLQIVSFSVKHNGDLTRLGASSAIPSGSAGLAAN